MPATRAPERADDDPQQAARVIDRYYAAIASHDYETAYGLWVDGGPPGQSLAQFIAGFEDTATVRVERGTAGRIGAAAGSRYIDVPVVIEATDKSGGKQRFEGTYTLRRSVVDGATPSQRTWHIYRGSIRRQIPP